MKTEQDIEQLLASGKTHSLSSTDKNAIKSLLLSHATASLQHEVKKAPSPWMTWFLRGSVSFAAVLVMFIGTAYAAQDSLPGEPLYAIKVHVVEEVIALTKTETSERMTYDLSLMETRLSELQALSGQTEILSAKDLEVIGDQIEEHATHLTDTIEITTVAELPHEEKIELLSKLSGITQAQVAITTADDNLTTISEAILDMQTNTDDSLAGVVQDFASEQEAEVVEQYLSEQITEVSEQVTESTTDEATRDFVEYHLTEANDSLADGAITEAIISVLEAQQTIGAEAYLEEQAVSTEDSNNNALILEKAPLDN